MNNFSSHLLIFLFSIGSIQAKTDKYRLTLRGNPSNSIVVRWNQVSGNNATVYYVTKDYVTDFSKYKFTNKADRKVISHAMNNHFARLKNLEGNTAYNFVIKDNKGTTKRFWFKTAPSNNDKVSFIAGGDSGKFNQVKWLFVTKTKK